jgi:hypothetical protein
MSGNSRLRHAWLRAIASVAKQAEPAICPSCGRGPISFRYIGDPATRVGYVLVWCPLCNTGIRISRAEAPLHVELVPFDGDISDIPDFREVG